MSSIKERKDEIGTILKDFYKYKKDIVGVADNYKFYSVTRLRPFFDYYNIHDLNSLLKLTTKDVINFLSHQAEIGNCSNSRNLKLGAIQEVFKYYRDIEKTEVDNGIMEPFYGVVLDSGSSMRNAWAEGQVWMDLAFESQAAAREGNATSRNVKFSVQRWGW